MNQPAPGAILVPTEPPSPRATFGWPAGSIRAILALFVVGLIWILLLLPEKQPIPVYL